MRRLHLKILEEIRPLALPLTDVCLQGAPKPSNEEFRVNVLRSYNILDTVSWQPQRTTRLVICRAVHGPSRRSRLVKRR